MSEQTPLLDSSAVAADPKAVERYQADLAELMKSKKQADVAKAMQIDGLQGLSVGDKMYLITVNDKFDDIADIGESWGKQSISLDIAYGIFAAVVPILIPFSQTYQETEISIRGHEINVGTAMSIIAVLCNLAGTIVHTYQKASKSQEQAVLYDEESTQTEDELSTFLARAGAYTNLANDVDRYRRFVEEYNKIRVQNSRTKLFAGAHKAAPGTADAAASEDKESKGKDEEKAE